jgi:hypothetical protein
MVGTVVRLLLGILHGADFSTCILGWQSAEGRISLHRKHGFVKALGGGHASGALARHSS